MSDSQMERYDAALRFAERQVDALVEAHPDFFPIYTTGGHWHHTEFAMDQLLMMRPTYGAAQYGTPIPGLYLCGAACHPGPGVTFLPGAGAAAEVGAALGLEPAASTSP